MFTRIDPLEPEPWLVARVADVLRKGGVAILPTDTVYAIAALASDAGAVRKLQGIKGVDAKKPLALLLGDVADVARWGRGVQTPEYRLMKRVLPGPYTFVVAASREVPKSILRARRTIGLRVPDDAIALAVLAALDEPLVTTSVRSAEDEHVNEPLALEEELGGLADVVVDGGPRLSEPSTVVDLSGPEPVLVRAGKGDVGALGLFG